MSKFATSAVMAAVGLAGLGSDAGQALVAQAHLAGRSRPAGG
jgi:hypothetical protein